MDIAVCDDNLSDREIIRQQLSIYFSDKFIEYNIDSYENGVNLIYSIEDGEYYDIIFLDMYMDKLNGIQVAEKLRNMNYKGKIIFLTVTSKYAVESYDVEASGYLVKPHDIDKISMVLDRVLSNYENVHTYQIKKRNSVIQVLYSEIEYIESSNSKCILHRTDGNEYTIYKKLNDIEEEINHRAFLRCHQSYLVNMNKIESVENDFTMKSGDVVPIRTRNLNEIKKEYYNYIEYRGNIAGTTKRLKIFYDKVELNFDPAVMDYQASVAADVDAINLTAVGADAGTQVLVNGVSAADGAIPVALQAGKNVIRIETASIDGSETAVYTLTVTRGAVPAGSTQPNPTEPDTQEPTKPEVPGATVPDIERTVKPQDMQSPSASGETEAPEQTETRPASNAENVEIPDTGSHISASMLAVLAMGAAAAVTLSRKKRR